MKSRKITNTGTLKNIGKFPSLKNGKLVWFESHLERDFIYLAEFDKDVVRYIEQPFKIQYLLDGKRHNYFPDFLLEKKDKKQVIEIKPQSKVEKDAFIKFSKIMKNHLAKDGFEYLVITDSSIRLQPKLNNIKFLWRYARLPIGTKHKIMLYKFFRSSPSFLFSEFCSFLNHAKEPNELIYSLIFHGYLLIDIEKSITEDSVISVGNFN